MWVRKTEFAKLLQDSESVISWQSGDLPSCHLIHEWVHEETGAVILREYQHESGEIAFWVSDEHFGG